MPIIELKNVSKIYKSSNQNEFQALNEISLKLPSTGMIGILGKSGSGKSTLLNIISMMDKPSAGNVFIDDKDIFKYKPKDKLFYLNEQCGFLFQNYNLLEDENGYYNVSLPILINGANKKSAEKEIDSYLSKVNLTKEIMLKPVHLLSGGERQRISLLRAIINSPRILFCDEPTGALDIKNSILVMNILKKYSERHLVLIVSHNEKLINENADRIIILSDGKIISDKVKREIQNDLPFKQQRRYKQKTSWIDHIVFKNIKRKHKRHILSFLGLVIGSLSSLLVIGFYSGSKNSVQNEIYQQFDYGVGTISKETNNKIENSIISIVQTTRPTYGDLNSAKTMLSNYYIEPDFSVLLPQKPNISVKNQQFSNLLFSPIYSFLDSTIDASLIKKGRNVLNEKNEVLINKAAYEIIEKSCGCNPLNISIQISQETSTTFQFDDGMMIDDVFNFESNYTIVGVVDELSFLQNPKIYYSYSEFCNFMNTNYVYNLSLTLSRDISWYERIVSSSNIDSITNYSYFLFLKNNKNKEVIKEHANTLEKPLTLSFNSLIVGETYQNLISSASFGLIIFLIITLVGVALTLGIISFSSYTSDKKRSAIFSILGVSNETILNIFVSENILICLFALLFAFVLSPLFSHLLNLLIQNVFGLNNLIQIPLSSFFDIPLFLPFSLILVFITIVIISTTIPILFNKNKTSIEELRTE